MQHLDIDQAVELAIIEDGEWQTKAHPSYRKGTRVLLRGSDGVTRAQRRPFRRYGHWCVRYCGIARLTAPLRDDLNGNQITFLPDWS